jgi:hypothetical protein
LDVGDTNWVITSSFIIFTMQTGEAQCSVEERCNVVRRCSSLPCVPPFMSSHQSKLLYDWRSVSQYVLVSGAPLGPISRFYFFLSFAGKLLCS